LQWREAIDAVIAALPEPDASVVRNAVEPADTHFENRTIDDDGAALSRKRLGRVSRQRSVWFGWHACEELLTRSTVLVGCQYSAKRATWALSEACPAMAF
jgi:hypothetical protein